MNAFVNIVGINQSTDRAYEYMYLLNGRLLLKHISNFGQVRCASVALVFRGKCAVCLLQNQTVDKLFHVFRKSLSVCERQLCALIIDCRAAAGCRKM